MANITDATADLALTVNGDLAVDSSGDLALVRGVEVLQQEVIFRLKTRLGDYYYQPRCGSRLEELVGRPNSPDTAALGESYIRDCLTHDGFIPDGALDILSWPDGGAIVFAVLIDASYFGLTDQEAISVEFTLDLLEGLLL